MGRIVKNGLRITPRDEIETSIKKEFTKITGFFNLNKRCYFCDRKTTLVAQYIGWNVIFYTNWNGYKKMSPVNIKSLIIHELCHTYGYSHNEEYVRHCDIMHKKYFGENWKNIVKYDPVTKNINSKEFEGELKCK